MHEIFSDAVRFWETRRVIYNVVVAAVFVGWVVLTWPHFREANRLQALLFLFTFFVAANVCYSAVYVVDVPMQSSFLRARWQRWRLSLWLVGTSVAFVFTNYWIADEIYPYVR